MLEFQIVVKEERMLESIRIEDTINYKNDKLAGIEEGIGKGIEKEKVDITIKMLQANVKIEDIANFTELSIKEIQVLKDKIDGKI